jgi:PBSX family phage terminase large subunit
MVSLSEQIAPSFHRLYDDIKHARYTHYWLKGGRGSTKSSFAARVIVLLMTQSRYYNAVVLRKVADTLKGSVYEQYQEAIEAMGMGHLWTYRLTPMQLVYRPYGNRIVFKGADRPEKIKSIKFKRGYAKFIHYEEFSEFGNMSDVRSINQSLMRGGDDIQVLYSYNPPSSQGNWVNKELDTQKQREDVRIHHSTYLSVPKEWLGMNFLAEAEALRLTQPVLYEHEYLGKRVGTGAEVFNNLTIRQIGLEERAAFDTVYRGIDFGFAADPLHYTECYYDKTRRRLYIYSEIHQVAMTNTQAVAEIKRLNPQNGVIIADSAEPRTISELNAMGLKIVKAKKGQGSVETGIKFLQDQAEIIIDPKTCPNTAREFSGYELDKDKFGNLKGQYPDRDNHSIDAVRYAMEQARKNWLI